MLEFGRWSRVEAVLGCENSFDSVQVHAHVVSLHLWVMKSVCSVLQPSSRQWDRLRKDILLSQYSLTFILLKVSTNTHCHSPYPSLSPYAIPPFSPTIPTLPYCSFCARRQKICLPYTQRCVPVSHKVQTAWESTAMNIKPVHVFVRECIYTVCPCVFSAVTLMCVCVR